MRIHAPEIEDETWCPVVLRDGLTDFLRMASEATGLYDAAAPAIARLLERHGMHQVVDLCSGGGGPVLRVLDLLRDNHALGVTAMLTDLYPNLDAFAGAEARGAGRVSARREGTDAADVPDDIVGVRTIFNGFHHFRPALARRIVEDAARKRQPFISIELVERRPLTVATVIGAPLLSLALTPFSRTVTPARLLLTYLAPIIPMAILWDGLMSCLRSYAEPELRALTDDLNDDAYAFRVERVDVAWLPARLTMLIGEPTTPAA